MKLKTLSLSEFAGYFDGLDFKDDLDSPCFKKPHTPRYLKYEREAVEFRAEALRRLEEEMKGK